MKYKLRFYCPAFIDSKQPREFEFDTVEELLSHPELVRVRQLPGHLCFEQIKDNEDQTTLMHIYDTYEFFVKAFISPSIPQWFTEWNHEFYKGKGL